MEERHDRSKFPKDHFDIMWDGLGKRKLQLDSCTSPGERWGGLDKGVRSRCEHNSMRLWNGVKVELKVLLMDWLWEWRGNRGWVLSFRLQQWGGWWHHLWRWENEQGSVCSGEREMGIREKGRGTPGSLLLMVSLRYLLDIQLDTAHGPPAVQGELRARRRMFGSGGHIDSA